MQQSSEPPQHLRRADWRFLLPSPLDRPFRHLVLVGGPEDLSELVKRSGIAVKVTRDIPAERCADAVVLLDNTLTSLRKAVGCLVEGGALYGEYDRRSLSSFGYSPGRVRRALKQAGLSQTGIYWIRPDLIRRQVYVPLHAAGPVKWYLDAMLTASSPAARTLEVVLRILERRGTRQFAALAPCYAVTAVAGPISRPSPSFVGHGPLPPDIRRAGSQLLVITQGQEDFKRVAVLPFAPCAERPLAVLKLARLPHYNACTKTEQDVLRTIRSALDSAMRESVPQPLGVVRCGDIPIGIESVAEGRSIASKVNRWGAPLRQKIDELRRAADWLTEFNCRVQIERSDWSKEALSKWIESPFAAYARAFGLTPGEKLLFARARKRAHALLGLPLPTVWVHWDFSEYNVYTSDREITVLDWERATPGPPLLDLLFFATIWSYSARCLNSDADRLRAFRRLFCERKRADFVSGAVHDVFTRYMASVGMDARFLPLLLVVVCVMRARIHLGRRKDIHEPSTDNRIGNPYIDWLGILAEDAEHLFSEQ